MTCARRASVILVAVASLLVTACRDDSPPGPAPSGPDAESPEAAADGGKEYEDFDPGDFDDPTTIDNPWFPLKPGTRFVWEGSTVDEEGDVEAHSVVFTVTDLTKEIGGVETVVCWDRDIVDGEVEEAEIIFFAQDNDGAVWQLGEYPEEYDNGRLVAAPGWLHGANGHAGIHMSAAPKLGDPSFSQGWAPSIPWTDRAVVHQSGQRVDVPFGTYEDVLIMDESNREEPDAHQLKYYARGVGNIKVAWLGKDVTQETLELVKVVELGDEELASACEEALKLEHRAMNEKCKEVFAGTKPSQRVGPGRVRRQQTPVGVIGEGF